MENPPKKYKTKRNEINKRKIKKSIPSKLKSKLLL